MELMDLMRTNRTYRRFKQTAVSDEIIGEIMEAARNASSAANRLCGGEIPGKGRGGVRAYQVGRLSST